MKPETRVLLESELIGWMMVYADKVFSVDGLDFPIFSHPAHRKIAQEIISRIEKQEVANPLTLLNALPEEGIYPDGVRKYLTDCTYRAAYCHFPQEVVNTLLNDNRRLELIRLCGTVADDAERGDDPEGLAGELVDGLDGVMREMRCVNLQDDYAISVKVLEAMKATPQCMPTGLVRLDKAMDGGLYAGKSYGFAARKKVGKTILAGTISHNLNQAGVKHLFICGEMSAEEVHQRTMARATGIYPSVFRDREKSTPAMINRIHTAIAQTKRCAIYASTPGLTFVDLKRTVAAAIARHQIQGFILDYWQLVKGKDSKESDASHLDRVAQWIADFCRQQGIWSITMAQINQEGNTRGGEGIRLAFDQVYQMHVNGDNPGNPGRWLEMLDTRYTQWGHIGDENKAGLWLNDKGPYFEETA